MCGECSIILGGGGGGGDSGFHKPRAQYTRDLYILTYMFFLFRLVVLQSCDFKLPAVNSQSGLDFYISESEWQNFYSTFLLLFFIMFDNKVYSFLIKSCQPGNMSRLQLWPHFFLAFSDERQGKKQNRRLGSSDGEKIINM